MKNEAVVKINKIGKIGQIISTIWFVIMLIAFVACLIGAIVVTALPTNLFEMKVHGQAEITVNIPESMGSLSQNSDDINGYDVFTSINKAQIKMEEIEIEGNSMKMSGEGDLYSFDFGKVRVIMWFAVVNVIVSCFTAFLAIRLSKALKICETPFQDKIIKNIQYIAYSLIPWSFIDSVGNTLSAMFYKSDEIPVSLDLSKLFICLIILAIAYIFKYGAKLQQEADETL